MTSLLLDGFLVYPVLGKNYADIKLDPQHKPDDTGGKKYPTEKMFETSNIAETKNSSLLFFLHENTGCLRIRDPEISWFMK